MKSFTLLLFFLFPFVGFTQSMDTLPDGTIRIIDSFDHVIGLDHPDVEIETPIRLTKEETEKRQLMSLLKISYPNYEKTMNNSIFYLLLNYGYWNDEIEWSWYWLILDHLTSDQLHIIYDITVQTWN
mgnify:CR=1 FL=1|jgi:hypothetical protein